MELLHSFLSEQTVQRIGWVLIHFLWQGVAVAAVMWCVLKMLGKASSRTRYIVACMGLALMVAAPVVTFMVLSEDAPVAAMEPVVQTPVADVTMPTETRVIAVDDAPLPPVVLPEPSLIETMTAKLEASLPYCVAGWFVGVAVLSVWYLGGWCQLQKFRRIGTKAVSDAVRQTSLQLAQRLRLRRAVQIAESALVQVPTVIGWLKPVILLPATALTGLDEVQLRAMIAHELAHIKRCDYLINIIQTVVEILGFYHPAVWWMSKQIRTERENCCDDIAVALVQNKKEYAGALFTMEAIRSKQLDLAVAANGGHLKKRINRLAGKPTTHSKSGWVPSVLTIILVAALLITTSMAMSNKATEQEELPTKQQIKELFVRTEKALINQSTEEIDEFLYFENESIRQKALEIIQQDPVPESLLLESVHIVAIRPQTDSSYQILFLKPVSRECYLPETWMVVLQDNRYKLELFNEELIDDFFAAKTMAPNEVVCQKFEKQIKQWKNAQGDALEKLILSQIQNSERNLEACEYARVNNLTLVSATPPYQEQVKARLDKLRNTPPEQLKKELIAEWSDRLEKRKEPASSENSKEYKKAAKKPNVEYVITAASDGSPVKGTIIRVRNADMGDWTSEETDNKGVAYFDLSPGQYELKIVWKKGFREQRPDTPFTVTDGEIKQFEIELQDCLSVSGIVQDAEGDPVANALVQVLPGVDEQITDSTGRFTVKWDPRTGNNKPEVVYVWAVDEERNLSGTTQIYEDTRSINVKLIPAVTVKGKVVDINGEPISNAQANVTLWAGYTGRELDSIAQETNADGVYEIRGIPENHKYRLWAKKDGYGQDSFDFQTDQLDTKVIELDSIVLKEANLSLSGIIIDHFGNPVPHAKVMPYGKGQAPRKEDIFSSEDGRFNLADVCEGDVYIQVFKDAKIPLRSVRDVKTHSGATDARIMVVPEAEINIYAKRIRSMGKLKDIGVPIWVWANEHDGVFPDSIEQVEFDDEALKEWAIENVEYLAAGKAFSDIKDTAKEVIAYDKNLSKTDDGTNLLFADGHVEFVGKENLNKLFNIDLVEKSSHEDVPEQLILKIVDESGKPVSGAIVGTSVRTRDEGSDLYSKLSWSLRGSSSPHKPISDENGIVTINPADIILEHWKTEPKAIVYVMHEGRKLGALIGIFTDKPEENEIQVTLRPLCHIHGKLINQDFEKRGHPLQWTNVYLRWKEQTPCEHMSEKQEFEFWIPPGQYELMAYGSGSNDKKYLIAPTIHKVWTIEVREGQSELDLGEIDLPAVGWAEFVGKQAPEIGPVKEWKNGSPVTLKELKGKPVVIYFDGDSPNINRDLPQLVKLHEQFADQGLTIISLYNNPSLKALEQKWEEVYDKHGGVKDVPFRIAIDGDRSERINIGKKHYDRLGATYNTYDINAYPTTILIDPQGRIVGQIDIEGLEQVLTAIYGMTSIPTSKSAQPWEKAFYELYRLEDGQILKRIAPPFIPERKEYYQSKHSFQAEAISEPPDYFTFLWVGELGPAGMGFLSGSHTLDGVLRHSLSIPVDQFEGPDKLLGLPVPGDWIVREGATDAERLRALEIILREELGSEISFQKRNVNRLVIVARGKYKFTPPQGTYNDREVHFYSDKLDKNEGAGGGTADTVHELISVLGQRTGLQVIDETNNSSESINQPYGHHRSSRLRGIKGEGYQTDRLNLMLKNLEKQTNLKFTVEERMVSKWFVVDRTDGTPTYTKTLSDPYGNKRVISTSSGGVREDIGDAAADEEVGSPQILTMGYFVSVPADMPELKGIVPAEGVKELEMIPPEKLTRFLDAVRANPQAKILQSPKILTHDKEDGSITIGDDPDNTQDAEFMRLGIKHRISKDGKSTRMSVSYEHTKWVDGGKMSRSGATMAEIPFGHAFAVSGMSSGDQKELFLIQPTILEGPLPKTDASSFGGTKPQGDIKFPRNWEEIAVERAKKLGVDPNEHRIMMEDVATEVEADPNQMRTQLYDVADLLNPPGSFNSGGISRDKLGYGGGGGGFGGGMGGVGLMNGTAPEYSEQAKKKMEQFIQMLKSFVPESWQENGGQGMINASGETKLIIYQMPQVHQQIKECLKKLREELSKQIEIEARILLVDENFLEDIGLDTSLPGDDKTSGGIGNVVVGPANSEEVLSALKHEPLSEGSWSVDSSQNWPTDSLQKLESLDDLQVKFILRATQAHRNAKQLQAPKALVLNGEAACMQVTTTKRFKTDADGGTTNIDTGLTLDLQPTMTADEKFVNLKWQVQLSDILDWQKNGEGEKAYQIPIVQVVNIPKCSYTVKDGETLLITGPELRTHKEVVTNPGLRKIPFVGRHLSNASVIDERYRILILIKPTIIIPDEAEEDAIGALAPRRGGGFGGGGFGGAMYGGSRPASGKKTDDIGYGGGMFGGSYRPLEKKENVEEK